VGWGLGRERWEERKGAYGEETGEQGDGEKG